MPRVLIVDDEKDFREIISAKLSAAGLEVIEAKNGAQAVTEAKAQNPDLILMDIHMPDETGTDVALKLKQDPATGHIPVAFLTNLQEPWPAISGDKEKVAKELGMDDFIEKTAELNVILSRVQALLQKNAAS